jgi:hypothetical protein
MTDLEKTATPLPNPPPQGGTEFPVTTARSDLIAIGYFAGAGLKSTFGAVEISFSFSTVKLAFSL